MIRSLLYSTLGLMLFLGSAKGQSYKQWVKFGDAAFKKGDDYGAALYYKNALDMDAAKLELNWKYAEALRGFNNYEEAEVYYQKVYKKDRGKIHPEGLFWLATMQKCNGDLKASLNSWKRLNRKHTRDKKSYYYLKSKQEMEACAFAIGLRQDSMEVNVINLGPDINTTDSEFSAFLENDTSIWFSTLRGNVNEKFEVLGDYIVRIHTGNISRSKDFGPLDTLINESGSHNANGTFSLDGERFYFSRCNEDFACKLMYSERKGNDWSEAQEISALNAGRTTTQPMVAEFNDKETIFFVSDRPGTYGKLDIWYAAVNNGAFGKVVNAGRVINSIDNEVTPFYSTSEDLLYFSSNWHKGLGAYDIFSHSLNDVDEEPKNLGFPINTYVNDLYYTPYPKEEFALFSSNRKGSMAIKGSTCCNDIYKVDLSGRDTIFDEPLITTLEELNRYLPVKLYFHNDEPDPRTTVTTTDLDYIETYHSYRSLLPVYEKEYSAGLKGDGADQAKEEIQSFFVDEVDQGVIDLEIFTRLLLNELAKGQKVELTVKGFASPLAKTDYNVNLTFRRVQSLINYMGKYRGGVFRQYLGREANNGGELTFVKIPFGEYRADQLVSDNLNDQQNSVYSRAAALERKIEIISVQQVKSDSLGPLPRFDTEIIDLGEVQKDSTVHAVFRLNNIGDQDLKILEVIPECGCTMAKLEDELISPGSHTDIAITFNGNITSRKDTDGKFIKNIVVITNADQNERTITITGEIISIEKNERGIPK